MTDLSYPHSPEDVIDTLIDIYRYQGNEVMTSFLESSEATIDYETSDNINGGTDYYTLNLKIPRDQFATAESNLGSVTESLRDKLEIAINAGSSQILAMAKVSPIMVGAGKALKSNAQSADIKRVWGSVDGFRVFLSHLSEHKKEVGELKKRLAVFGIRAFVAHEDIETSQDWQDELELALGTMHGMVAIVTKGFHDSEYTDQEIGIAMGSGVKIIAVMAQEQPPLGFLSRQQALSASLETPKATAEEIVSIFIKNAQNRSTLRDALVESLISAASFDQANAIITQIIAIGSLTKNQASRIRQAIDDNHQVKNANMLESLQDLLKEYPEETAEMDDDDIPF